MARLLILLLVAAICVLVAAQPGNQPGNNNKRDVCVLGGGASGMASAVFLKDLGYNPLVIEQASFVGGHCNTIRYPVPAGSPLPGYIDIGVEVYSNSSFSMLAHPEEGWTLRTDQFAARFAELYSVNYAEASGALNFLIDYNANLVVPVVESEESSAALLAYEEAFGALYELVESYPWLATGHRPDPVPAVLLVPFLDTVAELNLWPLQVILEGLIIDSGIGSLATISTLEALQILSAPSLDLFNPEAPTAGFFPYGGCGTLYNNIATWLGSENILLNANIKQVNRAGRGVVVSGTVGSENQWGHGNKRQNGEQNNDHKEDDDDDDDNGHNNNNNNNNNNNGHNNEFVYECDQIVVAFYPTLTNLASFDLSKTESSLFAQLHVHYYLALGLTYTGGSLLNEAFTIYTFNASNPAVANGPFLSTVTRLIPEGPAAAYVNGDIGSTGTGLSLDAAVELAQNTLNNFPGGLLTGAEIFVSNYHFYEPHFTQSLYATSPTPDTILAGLQGSKNTFYVGAATRYDSTSVVWNGAYEVITAGFPAKNNHHF